MTKKIYERIVSSILHPDGVGHLDLTNPNKVDITPDMFDEEDIIEVILDKELDGIFAVQLRGLNGIIPLRMFSEEAKQVILRWYKVRKSPLWSIVNDEDS